jgi:hypothetical protein
MRVRTPLALAALLLPLAACAEQDQTAETASAAHEDAARPADTGTDATVAGTPYHATTTIVCTVDRQDVAGGCAAGVKRGTGPNRGATVDITKPDGSVRTLLTDGTGMPQQADVQYGDPAAAWAMVIKPEGDTFVIDFGPEHYVLPAGLVTGG